MDFTVSITSQGQISIPAKLRRQLGLEKSGKALVSLENNKIVIEPVKDFLDLAGSLKAKAKNKVKTKQIRSDFENYLASEATKG